VNRSLSLHNAPNRSLAVHNTPNRSLAVHNTPNRSANHNVTLNAGRNASHNAALNGNVHSNAVRNVLSSRSVAGALHNTNALRDPHTRAGITASAATAGWHDGHGGNGWWRHRNGGYGWVGPLYWPFAYNDFYDYTMWGDGYDDSFWGYGYDDIYAGMFAPYGYDDLTGYLPDNAGSGPSGRAPTSPASARPNAGAGQLAQMCGDDSRDIAGLPIDQFQQAIQPNEAQRAALDDLANASIKAAQDIRAACPTKVALTAPDRLANMEHRIAAMIAAVKTVQPPLDKFYGLLSDEQKARITALDKDQLRGKPAAKTPGPLAQSCGAAQPGVTGWPTAEIERSVRPTEAQRASLAALQAASAEAADMLKAACPTDNPLTPPARLAAVGQRLDVMLQAVQTVAGALDDFYGKLTDEQKAKFEAIGPQLMSQAAPTNTRQTNARQTNIRRHHIGSIGSIIRLLTGAI
jgi:hypothetical protein